jgi:dTDP-4-dehydrorhamnose reductase
MDERPSPSLESQEGILKFSGDHRATTRSRPDASKLAYSEPSKGSEDSEGVILVVGETSQISQQLRRWAGIRTVVLTQRRDAASPFFLDLQDTYGVRGQLLAILDLAPISSIIISGAMTNVEYCETDPLGAYAVNAYSPEVIAEIASEKSIHLTYFSSEYVFGNPNGPCDESVVPEPFSVYGGSKFLGESIVQQSCPGSLIVRTTMVFGEDPKRRNFFYRVLDTVGSGVQIKVPTDQFSTPTYNRDLASATLKLVSCRSTGVIHLVGTERMSRYEFAKELVMSAGLEQRLLSGVLTSDLRQLAPRPLNAGLVSNRMELTSFFRPLSVAIREVLS